MLRRKTLVHEDRTVSSSSPLGLEVQTAIESLNKLLLQVGFLIDSCFWVDILRMLGYLLSADSTNYPRSNHLRQWIDKPCRETEFLLRTQKHEIVTCVGQSLQNLHYLFWLRYLNTSSSSFVWDSILTGIEKKQYYPE